LRPDSNNSPILLPNSLIRLRSLAIRHPRPATHPHSLVIHLPDTRHPNNHRNMANSNSSHRRI